MHEVNHTSETQLEGWKYRASSIYSAYNEIRGSERGADIREFPAKVKGMLTDHAEDQRKLVRLFKDWKLACEREVRGERALAILPPSDVLRHLSIMMDDLVVTAGGPHIWDTLLDINIVVVYLLIT